MKSVKIAAIAVLAALSIGTNYAMISIYNVKLMDFFVFIGGFCFGPATGMLTGVVSWVVYGTLNPVGFDLRIWFATMFAELLYGAVGGIVGKNLISKEADALRVNVRTASIFFGTLGMLLTFAYDVITNAVFGYFWYQSIILGVIVGFVPFGLAHVLSNAFFFGLGCVPVIKVINNLARGNMHGSDHK